MTKLTGTALALLLMTGAANAQGAAYEPLPVGTLLLAEATDDAPDTPRTERLDMVFANGADFIILGNTEAVASGARGAFLVEFSGVHLMSCDEDMPTAAERAALQSLWPLEAGKEARTSDDPNKAFVYAVQSEAQLAVEGRESGTVRKVDVRYPGETAPSETLFVAPEMGTSVGVFFSAFGMSQTEAVYFPDADDPADIPPLTRAKLFNCADLIEP